MSTVLHSAEAPQEIIGQYTGEAMQPSNVIERFDAVPEHSNNPMNSTGEYTGGCPFLDSMGDTARSELIQEVAEAKNDPNRGPTIRELKESEERQARNAQDKEQNQKDLENLFDSLRSESTKKVIEEPRQKPLKEPIHVSEPKPAARVDQAANTSVFAEETQAAAPAYQEDMIRQELVRQQDILAAAEQPADKTEIEVKAKPSEEMIQDTATVDSVLTRDVNPKENDLSQIKANASSSSLEEGRTATPSEDTIPTAAKSVTEEEMEEPETPDTTVADIEIDNSDKVKAPIEETAEIESNDPEYGDVVYSVPPVENEFDPYNIAFAAEGQVSLDGISETDLGNGFAEQLDTRFAPETVETYELLVDLELSSDDTDEDVLKSVWAQEDSFTVEPEVTQDFDTFVASTIDFEAEEPEPITLEVILEQSNEQLLEKTFSQLAVYLSELTVQADTNNHRNFTKALNELKEVLPPINLENKSGDLSTRITPELTEKLLDFLKALGYEQPQDELLKLVSKHGTTFLFQALGYFSHVNEEYNQEFSFTLTSPTSSDDQSRRMHLMKALSNLISKNNFVLTT